MPLYLVQAMIASIGLVVMLGGLYAVLVWYVDAVDYPGPRRYLTKFFVGSAHFLAHLTAMFTLSLFVVMLNNWMTPPIENAITTIYESRKGQTQIVQDVIEESLKPLQREAEAQQRNLRTGRGREAADASARDRRLHVLPDADDRARRSRSAARCGASTGC